MFAVAAVSRSPGGCRRPCPGGEPARRYLPTGSLRFERRFCRLDLDSRVQDRVPLAVLSGSRIGGGSTFLSVARTKDTRPSGEKMSRCFSDGLPCILYPRKTEQGICSGVNAFNLSGFLWIKSESPLGRVCSPHPLVDRVSSQLMSNTLTS